MQEINIAIIIPYFKKTFFNKTLLSLKNQTDTRFNVYIGDDCSPENPKDLIEAYRSSLNIKYFRFLENVGSKSLVKQWERCIKLTNKENWLLILGDDDSLDINVISSFYKNYSEFFKETNVIRFATQKIDAKGRRISEIYNYPVWQDSKKILFNNKRSSLSEYIFKKDVVKTIKFRDFPLAWFSDILGVLEFSDFSKIYSINDSVVSIRYSSENISSRNDHSSNLLKLQSTFLFYDYILRNKKKHFSSSEINIILKRISKTYINDKIKLGRFFRISFHFIYFSHFGAYGAFLKNISTSLILRAK